VDRVVGPAGSYSTDLVGLNDRAPPVSGSGQGSSHARRVPTGPAHRRASVTDKWDRTHRLLPPAIKRGEPQRQKSLFPLHFYHNPSSTCLRSTPASHRPDHPFLDSFRPEDLRELTVLLPRLLQLETDSFDPGTRSRRHHPPSTVSLPSSCFSSSIRHGLMSTPPTCS
jgi:hypothetical protein